MTTIQVSVDENTKTSVDELFNELGYSTQAAVRMFFSAALKCRALPLDVEENCERRPNAEMRQAIEDTRLRRNLTGPFDTVEEAMKSLLED
jgi:DNA-damage-inducible protein J